MSAKSRARRQRKSAAARRRDENALSIKCPNQTCHAEPGVWCGESPHLGPWLHELRYLRTSNM